MTRSVMPKGVEQATLKLTGPARDLHAVLGLLGLADATFDWDRGKKVGHKWRWKGTGPDKGQYRLQIRKPGTGREPAKPKPPKAPTPGHRSPSRTTVEEFLDELRLTPPGEWTPQRVQEVADWLCDDLRRDEIRELGRRMGYRVGAQLKNQLALDLVEQARASTGEFPQLADPNAASGPPAPTYTPTVGRHDELGIAPSDLDSIRRWAVADGHPMSSADEADVALRAKVLAHQGMDALRPEHIRQAYADWLAGKGPAGPPPVTTLEPEAHIATTEADPAADVKHLWDVGTQMRPVGGPQNLYEFVMPDEEFKERLAGLDSMTPEQLSASLEATDYPPHLIGKMKPKARAAELKRRIKATRDAVNRATNG